MLTDKYQIAHDYLLTKAKLHNPTLYKVLNFNGVISFNPYHETNLHIFLSKIIISQQLSKQASKTIWGKIENLLLSEVLDVSQLFSDIFQSKLSECGVSKNKIKSLIILNNEFKKRTLDDNKIKEMTYDDLVKVITNIWGLGNWTADMVAIFYVGLDDVWSENDVALKRGVNLLTNHAIEPHTFARYYKPYRSYLAKHIWTALDSSLL